MIGFLFASLIILMLLVAVLAGPFMIFRRIFYVLFSPYLVRKNYKLTPSEISILEKHNTFYKALNTELKKTFESNVALFLEDKKIIGRLGIVLQTEHRVRVAAIATQVGFGHFPIAYDFFRKILIYPSSYYSPITRKEHVGEANEFGFIALSWDVFEKGFEQNDGRNVGLHEFAHALRIEDRTVDDDEYNFLNHDYCDDMEVYFERRLEYHHESELLRSYAFTNFEEFFAVSVEYFFENPMEMYEKENKIFLFLREILKLDPRRKDNPVYA
jgi:Mlc titration factor MtfA (ptsG expression regulator)